MSQITIRPARPADVHEISEIVQPLVEQRILLGKDLVDFYEQIQGFVVAEDASSVVVGCGALHVMWEDLAEIRTLAVRPQWLGHGVGSALVTHLLDRAAVLGLPRLFCLTLEVEFFARHGFHESHGTPSEGEVYAELMRSQVDSYAECLHHTRVTTKH